MRLLALFARSRQTGWAAVVLVAISGGTWLWGDRLGFDEGSLFVALVLFPLFAGGALGVATASPFGEIERTASRPLADHRAIQIGGLLAIAAAGLLAASWGWDDVDGASKIVLRNLAAFTGISLLAALVIGGRMAWIAPVFYGIGCYALINGGMVRRWLLPFQPAGHDGALFTGIGLLLVGVVLFALRGARDTSNEEI